jgi:circadian clock protein KaiB
MPAVPAVTKMALRLRKKMMDKFLLKLFITGNTPRSERAIANLTRICEQELKGQYEMVIIDTLERPQLAEEENVLATPMLIKQMPPPLRRIIGDLSNTEEVLLGLDLDTRGRSQE